MKKYDVFKSQGGYGVATGIHLGSPVMGTIRWFENENDAEEWAKNKKKYDEDYAKAEREFDRKCLSFGEEEIQQFADSLYPDKKSYTLDKGITI